MQRARALVVIALFAALVLQATPSGAAVRSADGVLFTVGRSAVRSATSEPTVPTSLEAPSAARALPVAPDIAFAPSEMPLGPGEAGSVAIANVVGDSHQDLLVARQTPGLSTYEVAIFAGQTGTNGSELAATPTVRSLSGYGGRLATGTLDGDAKLDLAVTTEAGVDLFLTGGGSLPLVPTKTLVTDFYPSGQGTFVADVDGDGNDDVVATSCDGSLWFKGAGTSSFSAAKPISADGACYDSSLADMNDDGRLDLVTTDGNPTLEVYLQQSDHTFADAVTYQPTTYRSVDALATGDFNDDGLADVAAAISGNQPFSKLAVYLQQPDGSLGSPSMVPTYDLPTALEVADFNDDGRDDIAVAHSGWLVVGVHLQTTSGTIGPEILQPVPFNNHTFSSGLATGDLVGDARADFALTDDMNGVLTYRQADPTTLVLDPAKTAVTYGDGVGFSATLGAGGVSQNVTVTVSRLEQYDPPTAVATANLDADGVATGTIPAPEANASYIATWDGNDQYGLATSAAVSVGVHVIATGKLQRFYGTSGKYRLYHPGDVPRYLGKVVPNHHGRRLYFVLQQGTSSGGFRTIGKVADEIRATGTATVAVNPAALHVGTPYRIHCIFRHDADHLGDTSPWSYFRVR